MKACKAQAAFRMSVPDKPDRGEQYGCRIHAARLMEELNGRDEVCRVQVEQC